MMVPMGSDSALLRAVPACVAVVLAGSCAPGDVDLSGKRCPCTAGWVCDEASGLCQPGGAHDGGLDAGVAGFDASIDSPSVDAGSTDGGTGDAESPDAGMDDAGPGATWSAPRLLVEVNSGVWDDDPSVTPDRLTLWFGSKRADAGENLWVSRRASVADPWGPPALHAELGTGTTWSVALDGSLVTFHASGDLYSATLDATGTWVGRAPITELNTVDDEYSARITPDGLVVVFDSNRVGAAGALDLWMSTRPDVDSPFGVPVRIPGVNTTVTEENPVLSADRLTIWFVSNRAGGLGGNDVWVATRASVLEPFSEPVPVTELNSPMEEDDIFVTPDGRYLVMTSDRSGRYEIYESMR